jgi:hypothetical protein
MLLATLIASAVLPAAILHSASAYGWVAAEALSRVARAAAAAALAAVAT